MAKEEQGHQQMMQHQQAASTAAMRKARMQLQLQQPLARSQEWQVQQQSHLVLLLQVLTQMLRRPPAVHQTQSVHQTPAVTWPTVPRPLLSCLMVPIACQTLCSLCSAQHVGMQDPVVQVAAAAWVAVLLGLAAVVAAAAAGKVAAAVVVRLVVAMAARGPAASSLTWRSLVQHLGSCRVQMAALSSSMIHQLMVRIASMVPPMQLKVLSRVLLQQAKGPIRRVVVLHRRVGVIGIFLGPLDGGGPAELCDGRGAQ